MPRPFRMNVKDLFLLQGGRTAFVGEIEGQSGFIPSELAELWIGGEKRAVFRLEGEMLPGNGASGGLRALSADGVHCLDREALARGPSELRSVSPLPGWSPEARDTERGISMHRHLIGLDAPPANYIADPMTQGPVLPEGWDGDAWVRPDGRGYYLRAWEARTGRVAYGEGPTYRDARRKLIEDVDSGTRRAVVSFEGVG